MAPQLIGGWGHNYSTKTKQAGRANEQSIYSMGQCNAMVKYGVHVKLCMVLASGYMEIGGQVGR
jgi:hypothetical protein